MVQGLKRVIHALLLECTQYATPIVLGTGSHLGEHWPYLRACVNRWDPTQKSPTVITVSDRQDRQGGDQNGSQGRKMQNKKRIMVDEDEEDNSGNDDDHLKIYRASFKVCFEQLLHSVKFTLLLWVAYSLATTCARSSPSMALQNAYTCCNYELY